MIKLLNLIILTILAICGGCIGDSVGRVKGKINNLTGEQIGRCYLKILNYSDVEERSISISLDSNGKFNEAFSISPSKKQYHAIIDCSCCEKKFKSQIFNFVLQIDRDDPVDIGVLDITGGRAGRIRTTTTDRNNKQ